MRQDEVEKTFDFTTQEIRKILSQRYLALSVPIINSLGLEAAAWIADMLSKYDYFEKRGMIDSQGWFFNTQENIKATTGLNFKSQTKIIKLLESVGILKFTKKGLPSKNYYRLDYKKLADICSESNQTKYQQDTDMDCPVTPIGVTTDADPLLSNKNRINKNRLNKYSSKEEYINSASQNSDSVSLDKQSKHTLIRTGMTKAKEKDIPVDKPLNGPYKKIFDYWQMSGFRTPKTNTKTYKYNVLALKNLMTEMAIDKIVKVIDLLKLAVSPDYTPVSLISKEYYKKLYFNEFIFNKRNNQSLFKELLDNPPKPLKESVKPIADPDPEITNFLKNFYVERILGDSTVKLTATDENIFRKTTEKLYQFHNDNKEKYQTPFINVGDIARFYTNAIVDFIDKRYNSNMRNWDINFFKWGDFFNKQFPAYLFDMAIIAGKPRFQSPLNM
jgi:hypothetical protein